MLIGEGNLPFVMAKRFTAWFFTKQAIDPGKARIPCLKRPVHRNLNVPLRQLVHEGSAIPKLWY